MDEMIDKFRGKMREKREAKDRDLETSITRRSSRGTYGQRQSLPRRALTAPYRIAACGCGIAYKAIANKYFAGAACLAIAFGSGVAYGVKNAEDLRDDYTQAVEGTKEFVTEALKQMAESPVEKEFEEESNFSKEEDLKAYTISGAEGAAPEKTYTKTKDETFVKENKTEGLEGLTTEEGEEGY
ncbi:hypothetical protein KY335_03810 [Candidatus Woesearchaeota archaeon]|nr:hypothetical protein [Candidatus Woesearchaeota archaeon]